MITVLGRLRYSDAEFDLVRHTILAGRPDVDPREYSSRYRKKGQLWPAPDALVRNGIAYLDMGRQAHHTLTRLSTEEKRLMLGLILSNCSWANMQLNVVFHEPFELLAGCSRTSVVPIGRGSSDGCRTHFRTCSQIHPRRCGD